MYDSSKVPALIQALRQRNKEVQAELRRAYESDGDAEACLEGRAFLVDGIIREVVVACGIPTDVALAAVGGYGRGELYPCSDVDVLILLPGDLGPEAKASVERFVGALWDVGLELGHSVRTLPECLEEAARDVTVETNLLEARFLWGQLDLYRRFETGMREVMDAQAFYKAKRLEQEQRYARFNDTPYSLEPNCKESPGGLRDLQVIGWIGRAGGLGSTWSILAHRHSLMLPHEQAQVTKAENFLQHLRIRLHHLTGRREDRLLFDHQEAVARAFGLEAHEHHRASERLMQAYYRNAKTVTQLNTILLQGMGAIIFNQGEHAPIVIDEYFQSDREMLDVRSEDVFEKHPDAVLRCFLVMERQSELRGMTARTLRALWRARLLIDSDFRHAPENRRIFLQLFQQRRGLVHALRRMNQYGILGKYLPNFGKIVGQMQHDLFHVYTVDQHILQVVRNLRRFTLAEHAHEYPFCSRLITGFEKPWVLYVAALFHDIAKGRGGDHSKLGMKDTREFCKDHGISEEDTALIVFLVEHHLSMSAVAQKQDLGDPEVIRAFADMVQNQRRLTALYLLTVADIRGTSPKVWNAWKGKLLEDLFRTTSRRLRGDSPEVALGIPQRQEDVRRKLRFHGLMPGVEEALWQELDTVYFMRHDMEEITWHTRMLYHRPAGEEPVVKARLSTAGEGLQVMIYTRDQRDLFVRLCGFFARLGYSIVDAKIHTTRHGYALDSFVLLDPADTLNTRDMIGLIEHDLVQRLTKQAPPDKPTAGRLSRLVKHFPITPEVVIRPDEKGSLWILSITAADRPGLLFAVAQVLARHGINLHTAKIATLGERVEDTFLLSGADLAQEQTLLQVETELLEQLQT
ncbi:MAG: [protein-PII] uridylyltransferase [Rhodocyclaceae bacterium]|nr:[protein-PII] uridylyltransferase [Rhodocyclaceae bacterium]